MAPNFLLSFIYFLQRLLCKSDPFRYNNCLHVIDLNLVSKCLRAKQNYFLFPKAPSQFRKNRRSNLTTNHCHRDF